MIHQNPFTSETFTKIWKAHFNKERVIYTFECLKNLKFFKHNSSLPLFINVGKNITKGISYELNDNKPANDFKKKVVLIYDVPQYINTNKEFLNKKLKWIKIKQYPGYLTHLSNYNDFNDFLASKFSKKSRYKFNSYKRTLENAFDISYKNLYGHVNKEEYDTVFKSFHNLLTKRFDEKHESNNNLNPAEWEFYKDVAFPLILEKKASLFVIYSGNTPIAISLNYISENTLVFAMTVFDTDFSQYNVGTVHLMELYKWCFEQKLEILDLSKGFYDYKTRWGDTEYYFENHIVFDPDSLICAVIANAIANYFKLKQYLRDKKLNEKLHKLTFFLRKKNNKT